MLLGGRSGLCFGADTGRLRAISDFKCAYAAVCAGRLCRKRPELCKAFETLYELAGAAGLYCALPTLPVCPHGL